MTYRSTADTLKRISYNNRLRNAANRLGLSQVLNSVYFALFGPRSGHLEIEVDSLKAKFVCDSPTILRFLEATKDKEMASLGRLLQYVQLGDVVYDVGASFGLYSVFLAMKVGVQGKVIAFEPEGESYRYVLANSRSNQTENLLPYRVALGSEEGSGTLGGRFGGFSLLQHGGEGHRVSVIPGDSFIKQCGLPVPKIVKVDVEGFEMAVIKGLGETLKSEACEVVFCEVHPGLLPKGTRPRDVEGALKDLGFPDIQKYPQGNTYHAIARKRRKGETACQP